MVIDSTNVIAYVEREAVVVEFKGEHDLTTRNEVASLLRLLLEEHDLVVVDISEARFIDSSFLHNLFRADARARETCRRSGFSTQRRRSCGRASRSVVVWTTSTASGPARKRSSKR
jgi:anti-anti-sigma regulatory factor